jgi:DNA (cytosine-5)-methyltransferase 1
MSLASSHLGWKAAWLSEIEAFPSAVLAHHWPDVPNVGDMRAIPARIRSGEMAAPGFFTGGTPCQAFSVAGNRDSLSDDRGALTLTFCEIADAIDDVRAAAGDEPCIIQWENVPGCLSTDDNAFGCFLAGLVGERDPLEPGPRPQPGRSTAHWRWKADAGVHVPRWPNAGCVAGPRRTVAWRVLDAQYFGLAQRRERVFVVGSARNGFRPGSVLFESEGVRRDTAPSREAGQAITPTVTAGSPNGGSGHGARSGSAKERLIAPCWWDGSQISQTLDAVLQKGQTMPEKNRFPAVLVPSPTAEVCGTLASSGGRAVPGKSAQDAAVHQLIPMVAFTQNSRSEVRLIGGDGQIVGAIAAEPGAQQQNYIAFSCKDYGGDAGDAGDAGDVAPTLRAMVHGASHANAGGQVAVVFQTRGSNIHIGEISGTIGTNADSASGSAPMIAFHPLQDPISSTDGTTHAVGCGSSSGQASVAVAYTTKLHNTKSNNAGKIFEERTPALTAGSPPPALLTAMMVRRLIPRECERLQGMPDDHTLVPVPKGKPKAVAKLPASMWVFESMADAMGELRGTSVEEARFAVKCGDGVAQVYKLSADGPRHKAIGNSWAVLCVRWILERIAAEVARLEAQAGCA